jgi:hypothetical protein
VLQVISQACSSIQCPKRPHLRPNSCTFHASGVSNSYIAAELAAMKGDSPELAATNLVEDSDSSIRSPQSIENHVGLLTAFAEGVAAAWAASVAPRGSEPAAGKTVEGAEGNSSRAQHAQQARQQAPHVQALLTFMLMLCMAQLGAKEVDRNSKLLSNILLVCAPVLGVLSAVLGL